MVAPGKSVYAHAALGDKDAAFACLQDAVNHNFFQQLPELDGDPLLGDLHADPRYTHNKRRHTPKPRRRSMPRARRACCNQADQAGHQIRFAIRPLCTPSRRYE